MIQQAINQIQNQEFRRATLVFLKKHTKSYLETSITGERLIIERKVLEHLIKVLGLNDVQISYVQMYEEYCRREVMSILMQINGRDEWKV